ncbi:MAG TPA: asparagine synthase (glutamine-hydrolyzing) [Terriglobia bacterium]|nr:asparagine synthase (glutamine-hydrolyzing) [Terriglobia bacterium]
MCGIFGVVAPPGSGADPDVLWCGTHRVRHRGPDDWGFVGVSPVARGAPPSSVWRWWEERRAAAAYRVGLGNRRLSILDLSRAGRMPMNLPGTDLWITFNGEIYNYRELRLELSPRRRFATQTDTEVLLAAYAEWGSDCLARLNGMYAFALWDGERQRLLLARDRFGEKPLYYARVTGGLMFGSELKQFLADARFPRQVDEQALADLLLNSIHNHDERTLLAEAKQLPPAHWMEFDVAAGKIEGPYGYWTPQVADDFDTAHDPGFEQRLRELLADSIRLRLRSDVKVGLCLSGGLDSTAICALAALETGDPSRLTAYTVSFPGHPEDEAVLAAQCAQRAGVRHVKVTFSPRDLWDGLGEMVFSHDDPSGAGGSTFASRRVFEAARADGTVVLLNGQGGDELLAGYDKFFFFWFQMLLSQGHFARATASITSYLLRNGLQRWQFSNARRYFPGAVRKKLVGIWQVARPEFRRRAARDAGMGGGTSLNRRLYKDLNQFSLPSLLHWEDRNSMAAGTEARLPLLDHRIAEAVLATSAYTKLRRGFTKYVLRRALRDQLPREVCWQTKKRGFDTPLRSWLRNELAAPMHDLLSRADSRLAEFLDPPRLLRCYDAFVATDASMLTEYQWFRLAGTSHWLDQLQAARVVSTPELAERVTPLERVSVRATA